MTVRHHKRGGRMGGLVKGAAAGLGVAALGFVGLAALAPPPASVVAPPVEVAEAPAALPAAPPETPPETPPAAPRIEAVAPTSGTIRLAQLAPPPRPSVGGGGVVTTRLPQIAADLPPPEVASMPAPVDPAPEVRAPARAAVETARLPQIGAAPAPASLTAPGTPAWQAHRAAPPPTDRPPLALVLADPGGDPVDLPVAMTVALDPFDPQAPARAAALRAAGHEVALRIDGIAPGVTATDLEVMLQVWAQEFPQALALVEPPPGDARRARALAPVLIPAMAARGLALIAPDRGLSPLLAAARAAGVPAVGLHRALDAEAEDEATIRRRLDRAAFEAERLGRAAVWAEAARPETRAAIAGWPGTGRSDRVVLGAAGAALP